MNDHQRARLTRWLNTTSWPIPYELRTLVLDLTNRQHLARMKLGFGQVQIDLDLADCLQSNLYLDQTWERDFSNWAAFFAANSESIADVGAQIGYFTLLMSSWAPGVVLHAFEPNPETFRQLSSNVALNHIPAALRQTAIADQAGQAVFQIPHRFQLGSARLQSQAVHGGRSITVETIGLDAYMAEHNLPGFNLVKMDIEGAEKLAFRGMEAGLRRNQYRVILFEIHRQLLDAAEQADILETLQSAGYYLYEIAGTVLKVDISQQASHLAALSPEAVTRFNQPGPDLKLPADFRAPFP